MLWPSVPSLLPAAISVILAITITANAAAVAVVIATVTESAARVALVPTVARIVAKTVLA